MSIPNLKPQPKAQRGIALLPVVVMLLVLTLLVVASLQSSTLLERMTGNERDLMVAQQAAEAALRDAERDMNSRMADGAIANLACAVNTPGCRNEDERPEGPDFITEFGPTHVCKRGICYAPVRTGVAYFAQPVWSDQLQAANAATYGEFTAAPPIAGVAQQPAYWVEVFFANPGGTNQAGSKSIYRITARGVGRSAGTVVFLQSIYDPAN
jgi:type IV pilus assembly protein PilX